MKDLRINLGLNSYDIIIEDDALSHLSFYIKKIYKNKKIYIITDTNVKDLYLDKVRDSLKENYLVDYVAVKAGEESKSLEVYENVVDELIEKGIRRNELLIALGGGVVGDLTGFIAATLYRGLPYVGIPTSLLSQMDSSIGGKTGIDFHNRKNIIGCFKQPKMVIIDPKTLDTLPKCEFNNGMGELIKHGMIGNKKLFEMLKLKPVINEDIIYQSLIVKKRVVEVDEFDQGERMLLNFGHTFGHIIELEKNLKHGEAVAVGMLMALKYGCDLGITKECYYSELKDILCSYDLPCYEIEYQKYLKKVIYDKKNLAGKVNFILIKEIGEAIIYSVAEEDLNG